MDADRLLDGLDPAQRRAVTTEAQPLAILAGAGSGKTRVLTRRIAHRSLASDADPRHVLALTFTRKAAAELRQRLTGLGLRDLPATGTFHGMAYAQLRTRWQSQPGSPPTLLDRKGRVLSRLLGGSRRGATPADLAAEIEWAKARLVAPADYAHAANQEGRTPGLGYERVADLYDAYEREKRKRGLVDFDDLLQRCAEAIEDDPGFATTQRWRFRHLFVDEYQDVNPLQERLLRAWLGDRPDLCVVGDPNQAIYRWNGADASFLLQFAQRHPGAEVVELVDNYRSTPQILEAAAAVLAGDGGRARPLRAHRPDGPVPTVTAYASDTDEANAVARALRDQHQPGTPWSAQAVLVRTNAQTALIEASLRRARIPYRVRGAASFFDDPDVKELLTSLGRLEEPFATAVIDVQASLDRRRTEVLGADDDPEGRTLDPGSAEARRLAALEAIVHLGREFLLLDPHAPAKAFPAWLTASIRAEGHDRPDDSVSIVTFHAAKGLEWPVVHLAGVEDGFVPITHARDPEARAEERRLLYVALTRAERTLRVTWAGQRTFGERTYDRRPSPWLAAIGQASAARGDEPAPVDDAARQVAAGRAALAAAAAADVPMGVDPDLLDALKAWRTDVARQAGVRDTVVLPDRALLSVASHLPRSEDELDGLAGLGPLAVRRYGARLLALVAEHSATTPP